ncbi:MAG: AMP-binding protein [Novosphingobium sp.]|nr:AMP-binding protein [Novosphingobium sp.]
MGFDVGAKTRSLRANIRGGRSYFVWSDDRAWGDRPSETLLDSLTRFGREKRDEVFVDFEGELLTFGDLDERSLRVANGLRAAGVTRGDTVAMLMDNSLEAIVMPCAIARLGAIWVPINTAFRGEFLRHQLSDCEAGIVVCDREHLDALLAIANELPNIRRIFVCGKHDGEGAGPVPVDPVEKLYEGGSAPIDEAVLPTDIACLIYTSGTTGPSKGCMVSHNYLCSIGRRRHRSVEPFPGEVTWTSLPLFHIAALGAVLIAYLLAGGRVALARQFSVSGFWDEIERSRATSAVMLASMIPLLADAPDNDAMKRCHGQLKVVTGVPMSAKDRKQFMDRFGVGYVNSFAYGQTEANLASLLPWGDSIPPLDSMGPPSEDFDAMIAGEDGRPTPIGEPGELLVRPRQAGAMFSGYWRQPEATLDAMTDMWWHTGDFVRMDEDGYLYFVDRKKDYLRSRGENISSFEVESAMLRHGDVREVAFHTAPGPSGREEALKATVVLEEESSIRERALFEWATDNLPYFAVPRFIELRAEIPKNPIGRVQKHELRKQGVTDQTWDCEAEGLTIRRKRTS